MPMSCTLCRRRKVKCDRNLPCGNCVRAKAECIPSSNPRVPRGRLGGRKRQTDEKLLERISNLEGLVKKVSGQAEKRETSAWDSHVPPPAFAPVQLLGNDEASTNGPTNDEAKDDCQPSDPDPAPSFQNYLASSVWITLSEEISGLRGVLATASGDEDDMDSEPPPGSDDKSSPASGTDSDFLINPAASASAEINLTPHQMFVFCDVYLHNVDPVFKVLHAPSLRRHMQDGSPRLECSPGVRGLGALKMAICFAAAVSMTDAECIQRLGEARSILVARYRAGTEQALGRADFLNTMDLSTLQALTIYLSSVRVHDTRRLTWTLISVAVRIAHAMKLHLEHPSSASQLFMREMRRRLWWQICILDTQAAQDRATNPIVSVHSFTTKLPLNINDDDLHATTSPPEVVEREGFTDMTFCLVCQEITETVGHLNYATMSDSKSPRSISKQSWSERIEAVIRVQQHIEDKYMRNLNLANPIHWTTKAVADIIIAIFWLLVYRPVLEFPRVRPPPPPADPGILGLSVEILERAHYILHNPAASAYQWLTQNYVQWHPLSVTIAELCIQTEGPMVERAWNIVIPAFVQASQRVADSEQGMLWRPIRKLMDRAQAVRADHLSRLVAVSNLSLGTADLNMSDPFPANAQPEGWSSQSNGGNSASTVPQWTPLDWTSWLATASTSFDQTLGFPMNYGAEQEAWMNWETFVEDVQDRDESANLPGSLASVGENSSQWPASNAGCYAAEVQGSKRMEGSSL